MRSMIKRASATVVATVLVAGGAMASSLPASASHLESDIPPLPAGTACEDFTLGLSFDGPTPPIREFEDSEGNLVRTIASGRGSTLTFINLDEDTAVTVDTPGSVERREYNPDGSYTAYATGFNGLILTAPGDPQGPDTTVYTGRLVYTVSKDFVFEIVSFKGRQRDICAELS